MDALLVILIPVLTGLIQAMKAVPAVKARSWLLPLLACGLGIVLAAVVQWPIINGQTVVAGLVAGLSASGVYDAIKKPIDAVKAMCKADEDDRHDALS